MLTGADTDHICAQLLFGLASAVCFTRRLQRLFLLLLNSDSVHFDIENFRYNADYFI